MQGGLDAEIRRDIQLLGGYMLWASIAVIRWIQ